MNLLPGKPLTVVEIMKRKAMDIKASIFRSRIFFLMFIGILFLLFTILVYVILCFTWIGDGILEVFYNPGLSIGTAFLAFSLVCFFTAFRLQKKNNTISKFEKYLLKYFENKWLCVIAVLFLVAGFCWPILISHQIDIDNDFGSDVFNDPRIFKSKEGDFKPFEPDMISDEDRKGIAEMFIKEMLGNRYWKNRICFISLGQGSDGKWINPHKEFMEQFKKYGQNIKSSSEMEYKGAGGVIDKSTGEHGMLYYIKIEKKGIENEYIVEEIYYSGPLAGSGRQYRAKKINGIWFFKSTGTMWVS